MALWTLLDGRRARDMVELPTLASVSAKRGRQRVVAIPHSTPRFRAAAAGATAAGRLTTNLNTRAQNRLIQARKITHPRFEWARLQDLRRRPAQ